MSIFINPLQFGANEDFDKYPRQKINDEKLAKNAKIDIIFYPSEKEIYPTGFLTYVNVSKLSETLCGKTREGHFQGVATIVTKLLNIVAPDKMYLGQKDAQQAILLQRMIQDLNIPTKAIICPTVREQDGLALSSRNRYLSARQRSEASMLFKELKEARAKALAGTNDSRHICQMIKVNIEQNTSGIVEYVECVDTITLKPLKMIHGRAMIALAVKFGKTRLIDNIIFSINETKES